MSGLRRAEHARKAYFYQLALASKRARAKKQKIRVEKPLGEDVVAKRLSPVKRAVRTCIGAVIKESQTSIQALHLYAVGSTDLGEDLQEFEYSASRIETRSRYASLDTLLQYTPEVQAELFAQFERGEPLLE
jgi:hypothetical protein